MLGDNQLKETMPFILIHVIMKLCFIVRKYLLGCTLHKLFYDWNQEVLFHFIVDFMSKQKLIIICTSRNNFQKIWERAFENSKTGIGSWNPLNLPLKSSTHFEFSICILQMLHSSSTLSLCLLRTVAPMRDLFNGYSSSDGLFSKLIKKISR